MKIFLTFPPDLLTMQKTSSGTAREKTKCKINKVMIGRVPDRGGRAYEHEIPPPEMPAFQKRSNEQPRQQRQHDGESGIGAKKTTKKVNGLIDPWEMWL